MLDELGNLRLPFSVHTTPPDRSIDTDPLSVDSPPPGAFYAFGLRLLEIIGDRRIVGMTGFLFLAFCGLLGIISLVLTVSYFNLLP